MFILFIVYFARFQTNSVTNVSQTLCPMLPSNGSGGSTVVVTVLASSEVDFSLEIYIEPVGHFQLRYAFDFNIN